MAHTTVRNRPLISVVIPAYNEAENLPFLLKELDVVLTPYERWEILVVDDGSTDDTLPLLQNLSFAYPALCFLSFSRNFGHQAALRAGYQHAKGDCVICLDADGQHPPGLIPQLIAHWNRGFQVVGTRRANDPSLPLLKQLSSRWFYRTLRTLSDVDLQEGEADFRLLDRKVVDALNCHSETDLFLRGAISRLGFRQIWLPYQPGIRQAGQTRYSMRKMVALGLSGITSFSIKPLYLSVVLGFFMSLAAALFGLYVLYEKYFTDRTVSGWTTIILLILLIGGFQFIGMGIIGIYVGKAFEEAKKRPPYIVAVTNGLTPSATHSWSLPADELALP